MPKWLFVSCAVAFPFACVLAWYFPGVYALLLTVVVGGLFFWTWRAMRLEMVSRKKDGHSFRSRIAKLENDGA